MNQGHIRGRLRNRLNRLRRKIVNIGPDRKPQMIRRMEEIAVILGVDLK